jgi:hypothetical protein
MTKESEHAPNDSELIHESGVLLIDASHANKVEATFGSGDDIMNNSFI